MQEKTLLVEVRCEELPPAQLTTLARDFPRQLLAALAQHGFADADADAAAAHTNGGANSDASGSEGAPLQLATPRRFAALLPGIRCHAATAQVIRRGPLLTACYDDARQPTKALRGFMQSVGAASPDQLGEVTEKGRSYVAFNETRGGQALADALADIVQEVLLAVNAPRLMRWGSNEFKFIRPLRGILMQHGGETLAGTVLGVAASATTQGHPVLADTAIALDDAAEYVQTLETQGAVIVDIARRRQAILSQFDNAEALPSGLLDEVTALCEQPAVYAGTLDEDFLQLPAFCVEECMVTHQRAFPVYKNGALTAAYRFVADNRPADPAALISGMDNVLRARLRDVQFYFSEDKKTTLAEALEKLEQITYHRKLGSQRARVRRLVHIADQIGERLQISSEGREQLRQAAEICKCDLSTLMIGEYPALEGLVAAVYFCEEREGQPAVAAVAELVRLHNRRDLHALSVTHAEADSLFALSLALALEKLIGMFAAGEKPSGSKDPHGLRGAAATAAEVFTFYKRTLPLMEVLDAAADSFTDLPKPDTAAVRDFIVERKRQQLLEQGTPAAVLNAVLATPPVYLIEVGEKSAALHHFLNLPEAADLIEANKRTNNILRKSAADAALPEVDNALLQDDAECTLHQRLNICLEDETAPPAHDYAATLRNIAALHKPVSDFFDKVLVNADDAKLRLNRLALLARLKHAFNAVGDLTKLSGG